MRRLGLLGAVALAFSASIAHAQRGSAGLVGWVRDSSGVAVPRADISVQGNAASARTDDTGKFRLTSLDPGAATITIRRVGFEPETFDIVLMASHVDSVNIEMRQNIQRLDAVKTEAADRRYKALQEFYERRAQGHGVFFTREDLVKFNTERLSETMRATPGLRFVRIGSGKFGLRFEANGNNKRDCPPAYWIDGRRVRGVELDDFPVSDIQAIELYHGVSTTPIRFTEGIVSQNCGTVAIWTRIPGTP